MLRKFLSFFLASLLIFLYLSFTLKTYAASPDCGTINPKSVDNYYSGDFTIKNPKGLINGQNYTVQQAGNGFFPDHFWGPFQYNGGDFVWTTHGDDLYSAGDKAILIKRTDTDTEVCHTTITVLDSNTVPKGTCQMTLNNQAPKLGDSLSFATTGLSNSDSAGRSLVLVQSDSDGTNAHIVNSKSRCISDADLSKGSYDLGQLDLGNYIVQIREACSFFHTPIEGIDLHSALLCQLQIPITEDGSKSVPGKSCADDPNSCASGLTCVSDARGNLTCQSSSLTNSSRTFGCLQKCSLYYDCQYDPNSGNPPQCIKRSQGPCANVKDFKLDTPIDQSSPNPLSPDSSPVKSIKICSSVDTGLGFSVPTDPLGLLKTILSLLLSLAGGIALVLIIVSGYRIMASGGDAEKLKAARETLTAAIAGLIFIIFSLVVLQFITVNILQIPGFGS